MPILCCFAKYAVALAPNPVSVATPYWRADLYCFFCAGSFSRSSVNNYCGSNTQLTGVIMPVFIILVIMVITPSFYYLPQVRAAATAVPQSSFMSFYRVGPAPSLPFPSPGHQLCSPAAASTVLCSQQAVADVGCACAQCVLSVIIISALVGLFDFKAAWLIWKTDKLDFVCLLGAFFGVVFKSVEIGILIAVAISVAKLIFQVTRPHTGQPVDH